MRELLRYSALACPQLSLVTQRCFDWRNSAVSASAICLSITAVFPWPEVISSWHMGNAPGHEEPGSFHRYTCFLSSSRGFGVILTLAPCDLHQHTAGKWLSHCTERQPMLDCRSRCDELVCVFFHKSLFGHSGAHLLHKTWGHSHTLLLLVFTGTKLHFVHQIYKHFVFHPSLDEHPDPFLGYYSCAESSVVLVAISLAAVIEQLM